MKKIALFFLVSFLFLLHIPTVFAQDQLSIKTLLVAWGEGIAGWPDYYFEYMSNFDFLTTDYRGVSILNSIRDLNPDITVIAYKDVMAMYDYYEDWADVNPNEDWFIHDINGDRLNQTKWGWYTMDPGSEGWREHYANWMNQYLDEGEFDGIFGDDTWSNLFPESFHVPPPDYWNEDDDGNGYTYWQERLRGFFTYVKSQIGEKLMIGNGGRDVYIDVADGIWLENFATIGTAERHLGEVEYLDEWSGEGKYVFAHCANGLSVSIDQTEYMRYCLSCFLLGANGENAYFGWGTMWDHFLTADPNHTSRYWDYGGPYQEDKIGLDLDLIEKAESLGLPEGKYENYQDDVYIRYFDNGIVLANFGGTSEICLDGDYETLDGEPVLDCFTMDTKSGKILKGSGAPSSEPELIAYWKFDGNTEDSSGNGNDGTVHGATWTTDCKSGSCLDFDGDDDYVEVSNDPSLVWDGSITVGLWIKPESTQTSNYQIPITKHIYGDSDKKGFWLQEGENGNHRPEFSVANGTHFIELTVPAEDAIEGGTWYHVVGVAKANEYVKVYINGEENASTSFVGEFKAHPTIALRFSRTNWAFNGIMDEVKIWNYALTEEEIKNEYGVDCNTKCIDEGYESGVCREISSSQEVKLYRLGSSHGFSGVSNDFIANNFDMTFTNFDSFDERVSQVKAIRSDTLMLKYRNIRDVNIHTDADDNKIRDIEEFKENGWLAKSSDGKYLVHEKFRCSRHDWHPDGAYVDYCVDISNPDYQEWVSNFVADEVNTYGYDGVWLDWGLNGNFDNMWWALHEVDQFMGNELGIKAEPANFDDWTDVKNALRSIHQKVRDKIGPDKLIILNGCFSGLKWKNNEERFVEVLTEPTTIVDGIGSEGTWYWYDVDWMTVEQWKDTLDFMKWFNDHDMYFLPMVKVNQYDLPSGASKEQILTYAWASSLMAISTNKNYLYLYATDQNYDGYPEIVDELSSVEIGEPLGEYYQLSGKNVFKREFSKVIVLVNPSSSTYEIYLGEDYETLDGETVSSITMDAKTGEILLKTTPTGEGCLPGETPIETGCGSGQVCCCIGEPAPTCTGSIDLTLSPSIVTEGRTVEASVSGLENCDGKKVYLYRSNLYYTCEFTLPEDSCTFNAPSAGTYEYRALIDINGNNNLDCDLEPDECDEETLIVNPTSGGCPTLFVYDGNSYVRERKTRIHSQEGIDTVDEIVLKTKPVVENGVYYLSLKETTLPEHSHIDSVKLFIDGEEVKLISAWHSRYGDVTSILKESDDMRTDTKLWDEIELKFDASKTGSFIFRIEGYNPIRGIYKLDIIYLALIPIIAALIIVVVIFVLMKFKAKT